MTTAKQNLPSGWIWTTLGELSDKPQYGWTTKANPEAGTVKLLRTTDITSGTLDWSRVPYCSENPDDLDKYLVQTGDIVISRAGSVGFSYLLSHVERAVFASYLIRFRIKPSINKQYVYYYLKSPAYWQAIGASQAGIAVPNVNARKLERVQIPVAPEPQQDRIVAEIEKQFSRLDEAVANLKRVKANLKRYKAAVLKAAVEGKLTADWRKQHPNVEPASKLLDRILAERREKWNGKGKYKKPTDLGTSDLSTLPEGWSWCLTDALFSYVTSGSRGWAQHYSNEGSLFLRIGNLDHDSIRLDMREIQRVQPPAGTEGTRTKVEKGDILVSITADVGMIAVIPPNIGEAYINQHIALARPVLGIRREYLAWYLAARDGGQKEFRRLQRGATKVGLGLDDIRAVPVPLPPLDEQHQIVTEVERRLSVIEELETAVEANITRSDCLRQTVLQWAFEGRLIPSEGTGRVDDRYTLPIAAESPALYRTHR